MLTSVAVAILLSNPIGRISESELTDYVRYLASPELEGRLTTSKAMEKCATYIENEFKKAGLKPGKDGYIHTYPITVNQRPTKNNLLVLTDKDGKKHTLNVGTDYLPLVGSENMKPVNSDLYFVGYGLEDDDWNDYKDQKVEGKVVVVLRGAPDGRKSISNANKARTAAKMGAVGVIFVGPGTPGGAEFPRTNRNYGIPSSLAIVGAGIDSKFFEPLTGLKFGPARRATAPASKALTSSVRMVTELEPNAGVGKNVIGYLAGSDPVLKNEYIIVGGHFDHLGYGEVGSRTGADSYHGGADDNGSGTAAVMSLAKEFAKAKLNKRTIIFQCYSGEEEGLVGSGAWAKDNPEILAKTTGMINMDMIGTVRQGKVYVFGLSSSLGWEPVLNKVKVDGLTLATAAHVRGDSDQASFARKNVPVLFFHTGLTDTYHTEKDLLSTINIKGMSDVATAVAQTVIALDDATKLEFNADVVLGNKPDDRKVPPPDVPVNTERRIRVGFIPDMGDESGGGALISGTTPGSPAEKAGFKTGDRITKFNGREVTDLDTLNEAMKTCKPGDKVKIVFMRDGKEMILELTVEERP